MRKLLICLVFAAACNRDTDRDAAERPRAPPALIEATPAAVISDYQSNALAAEKRYAGKGLVLVAYVTDIGLEGGAAVLTFAHDAAACRMENAQDPRLPKLKAGMTSVTVVGTIQGVRRMGGGHLLELKDCTLSDYRFVGDATARTE